MSTRDAHLADVLCHCDQTTGLPEDGHPLGTPGCTSVVKAGRYTDSGCSRDHFYLAHCPTCHGSVRGTCPSCGKYVRVVQIRPSADNGKVLYGVVALGVVPHKASGQECAGTGQVPTETTYRTGRTAELLRRPGGRHRRIPGGVA